jgi:peroxiredoxin
MSRTGRLWAALILALLAVNVSAQPVVVTGQAKSYAGTKLEFVRIADWITGGEELAGSCVVSDSGNFRLDLPITNTQQILLHLGVYLGYFYAEPGRTYELVLPEKEDKKPEDQLNPYFKPDEIHLGLINFNQDELNMRIMMFEDAYVPYYEKHVSHIYSKMDIRKLETDIQNMEAPFQNHPGEFFTEFRRYRYGMLKLFANQQKVQSLSDEYFNNQPVQYHNPAYADLFNQVYSKYFEFYGRSEQGKQIYTDINQLGSYTALLATLSKNTNFSNDTLKELIILKQVHDEFYGNQFSRKGLLGILDTLMLKTRISAHRQIGASIKLKITRLLAGYAPPAFELMDTDGKPTTLDDFKGKYVYLNFCTCQSYACLNEFNSLSVLNAKYAGKLILLTIATDPMDEVLRQFLAKNKYNWKFLLYDRQPDVLKEYDIRAFPTYFLIGPDGKLILSPAPSPSEDFESRLFEIMKARGDL